MTIPSLIIDLDGTMIETGRFYADARDAVAEVIHIMTGMSHAYAVELCKQIETVGSMSTPSFDKNIFPRSMRAAYTAAVTLSGREVTSFDAVGEAQCESIGKRVYDATYPLYPKVIDALRAARAAGWQLLLYTKGDTDIQYGKIRRHNLTKFFDGMVITQKKDTHNLDVLLDTYGVDRETSWMIGDSPRDDIAPAYDLGLKTILITQPDSQGWSYNHHIIQPTLAVHGVWEAVQEVGHGSSEAVGSEEDAAFVPITGR